MKTQILQNKIAIVTASSYGLGYEVARSLAQGGAKVIISSRNEANVAKAVDKLKSEGLDVVGLQCHVGSAGERRKLFEKANELGGLDILVSNAAVNPSVGAIFNTSESEWNKIFDINIKSSFLLAKEAAPLMKKRNFGRIIFISSVAGYHYSLISKTIGCYALSKTTLFGLTKLLSLELIKDNITVNSVAPGPIATTFLKGLFSTLDWTLDEGEAMIPIGRFAECKEICDMIIFLTSNEASYISGENIALSGGIASHL